MIVIVYRREFSGLKILYTTVSIIHKDYSEGEIEKWLNSRIRTRMQMQKSRISTSS